MAQRTTPTESVGSALSRRLLEAAQQRMNQLRAWWAIASTHDGWWAVVVGAIAFLLDSHRAGVPSLWFDEAFSVGLARQPFAVMWHYLWGTENQMTLYYVLLHLWLGVLNTLGATQSEFLLRFPSLVAAALAAAVLYRIGSRWWGRMAGVVAALVYATNPVLLRQAQETRTYALQILLLCLAWYAFLAAIEAADADSWQGRWRWWIAFAAALTLAVYAHIDTVVCALAFPLALGALLMARGSETAERWQVRAQASIRPFLLSAVAVGIAILPLGVDAATHGGGNGWVAPATLSDAILLLHDHFLGGKWWVGVPLAICGVCALAPSGIHSRLVSFLKPFSPLTLAALAWFLVIVVLFTVLPLHLFHWRYLVVAVPPAALLVGIGASRVRMPVARIALLLILLPVILVLPRTYYASSRDDYRTASLWLNAHLQPGDGTACWPDLYCSVPMSYYVPALEGINYPGGWNWIHITHASGENLSSYLVHQQRVWLIYAPHGLSPSNIAQGEQAEQQQMAAAGFHAVPGAQVITGTVTIILYERRT